MPKSLEGFKILQFMTLFLFISSMLMNLAFICASSICLGVIVPRIDQVTQLRFDEGAQIVAAVTLALNEINLSTTILPNISIKIAIKSETQNNDDIFEVTKSLAKEVFNGSGVTSIIGPYYDLNSEISSLYTNTNSLLIPEISYKASSPDLGNDMYYSNFYRTSPSVASESAAIVQLLTYFGWENIVLFISADSYGTYLSNEFNLAFRGTVLNRFSLWPGVDYSYVFDNVKQTPGVLHVFVIIMSSEADAGRLIEQGTAAGVFGEGVQIIGCSFVANPLTWQSMSRGADVARLMKGVLTVFPTTNRSNAVYDKFVRSWLQQKSTIWRNDDGSIGCDESTDDEGAYLYKDRWSPSSPYVCTGVDFSTFSESGKEIYDSALNAYDAVYANAWALDTLRRSGKSSYHPVDILNALRLNVSFQGASGELRFTRVGVGSQDYGVGDRDLGITYKVLNFDPAYYAVGDSSSTAMRTLYVFSAENGRQDCDPADDSNCADEVVFNTANGLPPIDYKAIQEIQLSPETRTIILSVSCVGLLILLFFLFMVVLFRDNKLMKAAQPEMLCIALFGILLGFLKVIVATVDVTTTSCVVGVWLGHMAFGLVFGALILKTWRVNKVVNSGMKKVRVTQQHLNMMMLAFLLFLSILLVIHTVVANPHRGYEDRDMGTVIHRLVKCQVDVPAVTQSLFALEGILLLYGVQLCWASKDVPQAVNDSGYVSIGTYRTVHCAALRNLYLMSSVTAFSYFNIFTLLQLCTSACSRAR